MRKRRSKLPFGLLGLAICGGVAFACTAGSLGPPFDHGSDRPPDSRDKPGDSRQVPPNTRDNPGDTRQVPPSSQDNPGSQGGGPKAGGSNGCPPCDGKFKCVSMAGAQKATSTLTLQTIGGQCVAVDKGKQEGTLTCSGSITASEGSGSWTSSGPDSLTLTTTGTVQNQTITITTTCTRETATTTTPVGTATGTSPTPTATTTSVPVFDSGTSG